MKTRDIKTVDIIALEWFDRVNGNSYFSTNIIINYQLKNQVNIFLPMQYGYGDHYRDQAFNAIKEQLNCFKAIDKLTSHWQAYQKYNIIARHTKHENCLKRELNQ